VDLGTASAWLLLRRGFCEIRRHTIAEQLLQNTPPLTAAAEDDDLSRCVYGRQEKPNSAKFSHSLRQLFAPSGRQKKISEPEFVTVCFNYAGWKHNIEERLYISPPR